MDLELLDETCLKAEIDISNYCTDNEWTRLIDRLRQSQGLQELEITRSRGKIRSDGNLRRLFETVSNLRGLCKLILKYLSASDLSSVQGTFSHFQDVEKLLIVLPDGSSPISAGVAKNLSTMPQLREISMAIGHGSFAISNLFSPTIESIVLDAPDIWLEDEHFRLLVKKLKTNTFARLKKLILKRVHLDEPQISLLAEMLKKNKTLEELELSICVGNVDACCKPIVEAMSHNNTMKSFYNTYADALDEDVSSLTREMQNQMLHLNTTLENFELFEDDDYYRDGYSLTDTVRQKHFFLRLNKAGRKRLTSFGSTNDWIHALSHDEVRNDLPCLFHLLRMNPALWQTNGNRHDDDNEESRSRPSKRSRK